MTESVCALTRPAKTLESSATATTGISATTGGTTAAGTLLAPLTTVAGGLVGGLGKK